MRQFFALITMAMLSLQVFSNEFNVDFDANKPGREVFSLSQINPVEKKLVKTLVDGGILKEGSPGNIRLSRLSVSDWFGFSLNGETYLTDANASHILKSDLRDFFHVSPTLSQVSMSNGGVESLFKLTSFLRSFESDAILPVYKSTSKTRPEIVIYAFMDVTCPFCKKFHLLEREQLNRDGVTFIYIPFTKNYSNKKDLALNYAVFCQSASEKKNSIDDAYLAPKITRFKINPNCNLLDSTLIRFFLKTGEMYGVAGSPMFLSRSGKVMYGTPSLIQFVRNRVK
jgi:hypothetical protein